MIICFFSAQYLPTVGGVERFTAGLANRLTEYGHRVIVVTSSLKGFENEEESDGVTILRVPSIFFADRRLPVALPFFGWNKIKQKLKKLNIDFIVVQTRLYPLSLLGARFAKSNNVRSILIEHSTKHLILSGAVGKLCSMYEHFMMNNLRRSGIDFYGVSKACTDWLEHFKVKTDSVVYNFVDPKKLDGVAQSVLGQFDDENGFISSLIAPAKITIERPIFILYSGRFVAEKGVMQLLHAFDKLRLVRDDVYLLLAGDGPQLKELKRVLPTGAFLLGMLPYEKNIALMKSADIFCLPTKAEGFSTTVLEAAALKTTVLTTCTGGSPELILNDEYGIIMEDDSIQTIEESLKKATRDAQWRALATENAYRLLCENFTLDSVSKRLLDIVGDKDYS